MDVLGAAVGALVDPLVSAGSKRSAALCVGGFSHANAEASRRERPSVAGGTPPKRTHTHTTWLTLKNLSVSPQTRVRDPQTRPQLIPEL